MSIEQEIKKLREEIEYHNNLYYNEDNPEISDYEYDALTRRLRELEAECPELVVASSPTQKVGGKAQSSFANVTHSVPMLSLRDVFSTSDVEDFLKNPAFDGATLFSIEEKIDGLSMSVIYENGEFVRAETRGDGYIGEDITENAKLVKGLPHHVDGFDYLEVRCEVYLPVADFLKANKEKASKEERLYANPRNAAAGLLRTHDIEAMGNNLCAFVFNIQDFKLSSGVEMSGLGHSHFFSLEHLKAKGFSIVKSVPCRKDEVIQHINEIGKYKNKLSYWIDGAVVKVDDIELRKKLGETSKYPHWAVAFKYPPEEKETIIRDIALQTGRTGRVTPVAIFDEVELAGTRVSRASLHNQNIINKLGVGVGSKVIVRKAAEIIPEVIKVVSQTEVFDMSTCKCPSCGNELTLNDGLVPFCRNPLCPAQMASKLEFWASRDCMDIRGLGAGVVSKLIDNGLLHDIPDIYKLKEHRQELIELDGFGEKGVDNLLNAIEKSKDRDIDRLIKGLGIEGVGRHIGKAVANKYLNIFELFNIGKSELAELEGVGEIAAKAMRNAFQLPYIVHLLRELKALGVNTVSKKHVKKQNAQSVDSAICGKTFVITGTLSKSRDAFKGKIEELGGKVSGSVSKKTDYLLAGENAGGKLNKAETLGVRVISEEEFKRLIY